MGISANTNVGSTALQLELTYRPDFPLATDGSDQGQQLADAAGTTTLLAQAVAKGFNDTTAFDGNAVSFEAEVDAQGQTLVLDFNGTVEGDSMDGEFGSDFGAFGVSGSRQ